MKLFLLITLWMASLSSVDSMAQSLEVSDVVLPDALRLGKTVLVLNGAGVQEVFWIDMYVAALYLPRISSDAQSIIDADEPMAIRLESVSGLVSARRMEVATRKAFKKTTGGKTAPYAERMEMFINLFKGIKIGKEFTIVHVPGIGIKVYSSGKLKVLIRGFDFKKMLFNIWLGNNGADGELRDAMLGI